MIVDLKNRIWGLDVSHWQDYADTAKLPDLQKAKELGCRFIIARSLDGNLENGKPHIDRLFWYFMEETYKAGMLFGQYPYLNYLSHQWLGINSTQWGIVQGEVVAGIVKYHPMPVWIDAESAPGGPKIEMMWGTAMTIYDNMLKVIDDANGRATGEYWPTGWLTRVGEYRRWRALLAANYNAVSEAYVRQVVTDAGWSDLVMIQVNSLGDINGDLVPDGRELGFENPRVDVDVWCKSEEELFEFFGEKAPEEAEEPPVVIDYPDDEVQENPNMVIVEKKTVKLAVRVRLSKSAPSLIGNVISGVINTERLTPGEVVHVLQRVVSGRYTWVQIGWRQWCCEKEIVNGKDVVYLE